MSLTVGAKYDGKYRNAKTIAQLVREDIKAAKADGSLVLPVGTKISVRSEYFSMGQAVRIGLNGVDYMDATVPVTDSYGDRREWKPEFAAAATILRELVDAYTYREVDSQVDYFNISCYTSVTIDGCIA